LGGAFLRLLFGSSEKSEFSQPAHRYSWKINPEKCRFCGRCATSCVRSPSAVKAVNDLKKCSYCVACYGHVRDTLAESEKIDAAEGVCPRKAVVRKPLAGGPSGFFTYTIDASKCVGCGSCAKLCNEFGNKSMFLIIRPDLCLVCNQCSIVAACPHGAVERVHMSPTDDFRGERLAEMEGGGAS